MDTATITPTIPDYIIQRMQKRFLRVHEHFKYTEEMLSALVTAKRLVFILQTRHIETYAQKLLFQELLARGDMNENTVTQITLDSLRDIQTLCNDRLCALFAVEIGYAKRVLSLLDAGEINRECYDCMLADVMLVTDKTIHAVMEQVEKCCRKIIDRFAVRLVPVGIDA